MECRTYAPNQNVTDQLNIVDSVIRTIKRRGITEPFQNFLYGSVHCVELFFKSQSGDNSFVLRRVGIRRVMKQRWQASDVVKFVNGVESPSCTKGETPVFVQNSVVPSLTKQIFGCSDWKIASLVITVDSQFRCKNNGSVPMSVRKPIDVQQCTASRVKNSMHCSRNMKSARSARPLNGVVKDHRLTTITERERCVAYSVSDVTPCLDTVKMTRSGCVPLSGI